MASWISRLIDASTEPRSSDPDIGQLQDLLGLLKIHDCPSSKECCLTSERCDLVALMQIKEMRASPHFFATDFGGGVQNA